jgi:hypothetical protein
MDDAGQFLRRFERDALICCAAMAGVALLVPGGGPRAAAAVIGGGVLAGLSYRAIRGAVAGAGAPRGRAFALVKFFTRHAILAFAAYVMLARLRLHPVGVLGGASSLVMAAMVAAVRALRPMSRSGHPRP